jgi:hypothetical protein
MRRNCPKAIAYTLVVALSTPAAAFAAGSTDDRSKGPAPAAAPVVLPSIVMSVTKDTQPTSLSTRRGWQEEIARATATVMKQTGRVSVAKAAPRGIRRQGTGAMVTMIVSTVVGLAATVYMLKYMKDQQNDDNGGQ